MPYSTTLSIKKTDPPDKKPKAVKDRGGGVEGRFDCGQRFNVFFKASLKCKKKGAEILGLHLSLFKRDYSG